jgi:hypothetical protein
MNWQPALVRLQVMRPDRQLGYYSVMRCIRSKPDGFIPIGLRPDIGAHPDQRPRSKVLQTCGADPWLDHSVLVL